MFVVINSSNSGSNDSKYTHLPGDVCMFQRSEPNVSILLVYGLAVPTLATFGLCTNFINAVVFMRPKMTPSAFTYLAALSCLDCVSCLLITMTALSRSYFYTSPTWVAYDYQWQTPLFGISTGAANLILACVSLDRFIYLSRFKKTNGAPSFCRRKVARIMICIVILVSVVVNLPYFFVFYVDPDSATCYVTDFYYSKIYEWQNWFSFALLAVLPAIFLCIGNTAILIAFCRWTKQSKICNASGGNTNVRTIQKRYQHQMKLTISIVIVITLYMVGELPAHMTSRKSSLNLIFGGDANKVNEEEMERLEVIFITLNALQLSMNIVVYGVINPSFMPEFFLCLRGASDFCFRLCCLPAMARGCRRCWDWTQRGEHPTAEERVVSFAAPDELPAEESPHCGCESWSSDSGCDHGGHCRTPTGTFAFLEDYDSKLEMEMPQPVIFTTKSSAGLQQMADQTLHEEEPTCGSFIIPT